MLSRSRADMKKKQDVMKNDEGKRAFAKSLC